MNPAPQYMDVTQSHMNSTIPSSAPSNPMSHYSSYQQTQQMHNPSNPYGSSPTGYASYGYTGGLAPLHNGGHPGAHSMGSAMMPQSQLSLPGIANTVATGSAGGQPYQTSSFDTTGQIAPAGMKPRVTATLWEDEGSLCFQVEASGVCVARREDNHMINGTKLLNVAGMTRGRRDGILKSEKTRHVVKIGPMHLKGVWIPFERALDFANKEKITESLYPLFVHNIGALLYHPQNNARQSISSATAMAAADRRRPDAYADHMRTPSGTQPPSLPHQHSMPTSIGAHPAQPSHSIAPLTAGGRPGLNRVQTFPTPPTSASSMMGMGGAANAYEWNNGAPSTMPPSHALTIDTSLSNAKSVPTTPATTPPGPTMQNMATYQTTQPYENGRPMYTAPPQPGHYNTQPGMNRYGQLEPSPYIKNEMAPPARANTGGDSGTDPKAHDGYSHHAHAQHHSDETEGEHDSEYTHAAGPYGGSRSYAYGANATPTSLHGDQHIPGDMTASPHKASGGATPRTTNYNGYSTPQKSQLPSSNLYSVMSDNRGPPNGSEIYGAHGGYAAQQYGAPNGIAPSNKRVRELDDNEDRYSSDHADGLKRQRTVREDSVGRPRPVAAQKKR